MVEIVAKTQFILIIVIEDESMPLYLKVIVDNNIRSNNV